MIKIMKSFNIIKDALYYPLRNWKKMLILSFFMLLITFISLSPELLGNGNVILGLITLILGFVLSFIFIGYYVSIISNTIHGLNKSPKFEWLKNFVEGIELVILISIYCIIPIVIIGVVAFATGLLHNILQLGYFMTQNTLVILNTSSLPSDLIKNIISTLGITAVVAIIINLLFLFIFYLGLARFADKNNVVKGMDLGTIINTIDDIGIGLYIAWFIEFTVILFIGLTVNVYSLRFQLLGFFLATFIVRPYIMMFSARSIGLIYKES